jgi:hypothetical protein
MSRKNAVWAIEITKASGKTRIAFMRETSCNHEYTPTGRSLSRVENLLKEQQSRIDFDFNVCDDIFWVTADVSDLRGELFGQDETA